MNSSIGNGNKIQDGSTLNGVTSMGNNNTISNGWLQDSVTIGDNNALIEAAVVANKTRIGNNNLLSIQAWVTDGSVLGDNNKLENGVTLVGTQLGSGNGLTQISLTLANLGNNNEIIFSVFGTHTSRHNVEPLVEIL